MASWFTRALDRITPWDRGGEVERRKKREEEQAQARRQTTSTPQAPRRMPTTQQPQNVFSQDVESVISPRPNIGLTEVISPDEQQKRFAQAKEIESRIPKPQQSNWNKIRDIFDANTEADQYRRSLEIANEKATENRAAGMDRERAIGRAINNARILSKAPARSGADDVKDFGTSFVRGAGTLAPAAGRVVTGVGEGILDLGGFVAGTVPNAAYRGLRTGSWEGASDNVVANQLKTFRKPIDATSRFMDRSAKAIGGEQNMPTYKYSQIAMNIIPVIASGGTLAAAKAGKLSEAGKVANASKWARAADWISGASKESKLGKVAEFLDALQSPVKSLRGAFSKNPETIRVAEEGAKDIGDVLTNSEIDDIIEATTPKDIPVRQQGGEVPIPVDKPSNVEGNLIREIGGDAREPGRMPTSEELVTRRFNEQPVVRPDQNIEGVRNVPTFNKPLGEAGGVTKVEIDTERAMLDEALTNGEINKTQHNAANKALDEVVPTDADLPPGKKIEVKQVESIPVREEVNVPQGLPETPGTVRATTATAPAKTEAKLVAETQPPATNPKNLPKSEFDEGGLPPTTNASETSSIPSATENDLRPVYERVVENLREQRKAYRGEKKLRKFEFNKRKANYDRIYEEARASGKSSQEAEQMARAALGGEYTKGATANFEIDPTDRNKLFDRVHNSDDNLNTKKAFEHLFDEKRTEPLRDWERTRIRRFIQKELGADEAQQLDELIAIAEQNNDRSLLGRAADFMTSSIAAGDVSAAGRQGLSGLINHPKMSKQAWDDALGALMSEDKLREFATKLSNDPYVAFIQEKGGQHGKYQTLTDIADEARGVSTNNRLTSWYVNPSNRHYNVYLDSLRHQQKKAVIDKFGGIEGFEKAAVAANPENPDKWMQAWFKVIDRQSGRGTLVKGGGMTAGDVQVLFSARNMASKFQRLASPFDISTLRANPQAYLRQLRETGVQLGAAATTLGVLKQSGLVDVEDGKIKVGPTRIDITGGFATIFKAANDIRKAIFDTESQGGFDRSGGDVVKDYFQNQLSPLLGTVLKVADIRNKDGEWQDKYGNPIDAKWLLDAAPAPAVAKTFASDMAFGLNPLEAARNAALSGIGFNTNTYLSAEDKDNAARAETADTVNAGLQSIRDTGLLSDKMIQSIDDEDVRDILTGKSDKQLSEDEFKKVRNKLVGGITAGTGNDSDSAYRERGEYDKDIAALRLKREMVEADPNHKPSDIKSLDIQIKRSEMLRDNDIPFELLEKYQKTGVEDWRKLEEDDPELFQQLWAIDEMMTKEGVGYKSGSFTEQKYYQKSGRGGRGGKGGGGGRKRSWSADFGKITGSNPNAPKVKEYQTMEQAVGKIPYIKRTRPNIVHTIREGRV